MIAEGTDTKDVTEEQVRQVAADVELFCRTYDVRHGAVAKAVGYSRGVLSDFLAGKYTGNQGRVAIHLDDWLVTAQQQRSRPETTQFVWTNVALEIKSVANYCLDKRKISLVYGPETSGFGKTTALRAIQQELGPRRCSLVTIDKVDYSPSGLLKKLCSALGKDNAGCNRRLFTRIVEHLSGRSHLLLIDQIHNLRDAKGDRPFYILADIYDATKSAQLWCGTADLHVYLMRQQTRHADESLAQIRRRIFPTVDLLESFNAGGGDGGGLLVTAEQTAEMFAKNKLRLTAAGVRFLCRLCNLPDSGSVGLCEQIVEYATMLAEMRRLPSIDVPLLQESLRRGFTPERASDLFHRLDVAQPRAAKVG